MASNPNALLTPLDAAKLLGVSTDSVRNYADKGALPHERTPSGRRLFRWRDVETLRMQRELNTGTRRG